LRRIIDKYFVSVDKANEEKVPEKSYNESYFCSYSGYIVGITILFLSTSVLGGILMWMIFRNEAYWKVVLAFETFIVAIINFVDRSAYNLIFTGYLTGAFIS